MKIVLTPLFLLFLFFGKSIFAQEKYIPKNLEQLDSISAILLKARDFEQLLPHAKQLIQISKELSEKPDTSLAKRFYILGIAEEKNKLWDAAEQSYLSSIQIFEQQLPISEHHAKVLNRLGRLHYYNFQNEEESERLWKKVLLIRKQVLGIEHPNYAISLMSLGALHYNNGAYDQAEDLFLRALKIQQRTLGIHHIHYASSLTNLANIYSEQGQYEKAIRLSEQSLKIIKDNYGISNSTYANSVKHLGLLHYDMGSYNQAKGYYKLALKIEKEQAPNSPEYAFILNNLGNVCVLLEEYQQAKSYTLKALDILKTQLEPGNPRLVDVLTGLAGIYLSIGDYEKAEQLYLTNKQYIDASYSVRHPYHMNYLNNMVKLFITTNQLPQAWKYLQQAINNNSNLSLQHHNINSAWQDSLKNTVIISIPEFFTSLELLFNLVRVEQGSETKQKSILINDLAFYWFNRFKNSTTSTEDKLRVLKESNTWVLQCLSFLDLKKDVAKAFSIAEQNKSVLLLDALHSSQRHQLGRLPDSLVQQQKRLETKLTNTKALMRQKDVENNLEQLRVQLNKLNLQLDDLNKKIQTNYPNYVTLKNAGMDINASDIQKNLSPESALIEYVISTNSVYIFYLDQQSIQLTEVPISTEELEIKIHDFHNTLSSYQSIAEQKGVAISTYATQAFWFYQKFIAPVNIPKNINHLILVPDGKLGYLPFETFLKDSLLSKNPNYTNLSYLMNDYEITYSYSAALWKENTQQLAPSNNDQILGIAANYLLPLDSNMVDVRPISYQNLRDLLPPLPNAKAEVLLMADNYKGTFAFDLQASEGYFKTQAKDYSILHLAMHGILNNKNPMLSSLVFTENNDSTENNFLQAYEISNLTLNADLVILSACETGYGKVETGNGLASLARAFMYAGAPSLVVSLWQVNDYATSQIMQRFYKNLSLGMTKAEALTKAKQTYIKNAVGILGHPAFWSPFIQIGNEAPISVYSKNEWNWSWIVGIALLSIVLMGLVIKQRRAS